MPDTTPLAPMTPHAAISAFNCLRAVQADDAGAARELAGAEPRMPELLADVATRIVVPRTALPLLARSDLSSRERCDFGGPDVRSDTYPAGPVAQAPSLDGQVGATSTTVSGRTGW